MPLQVILEDLDEHTSCSEPVSVLSQDQIDTPTSYNIPQVIQTGAIEGRPGTLVGEGSQNLVVVLLGVLLEGIDLLGEAVPPLLLFGGRDAGVEEYLHWSSLLISCLTSSTLFSAASSSSANCLIRPVLSTVTNSG